MVTARAQAKGLNASEAEDCAADVLSHLAIRSIPRYKPERGSMTSYLNACAMNQVPAFMRTFLAARRRNPSTIPGDDIDRKTIRPSCMVTDQRIETLADELLDRPGRYLTPRQAVVLRAVFDRAPGVTLRQVSRELGYGHPSHLSHILKRIRLRMTEIAQATAGGDIQPTRPAPRKPNPRRALRQAAAARVCWLNSQGTGRGSVDHADHDSTHAPGTAHAHQPQQRKQRDAQRRRASRA